MMPFKKYYEHVTLGIVEPVFIEEVGEIDAKIDSGNEGYNVLGATGITKENDKVRFMANGNTLVKKIVEEVEVHVGANHKEPRFVVHLNMKFKGSFYEDIPFSLGSREEKDYKVLIGEIFLKKIDALIQVNKPGRLSESE